MVLSEHQQSEGSAAAVDGSTPPHEGFLPGESHALAWGCPLGHPECDTNGTQDTCFPSTH